MNAAKRNYNGWILCPSKRFPTKFYYFNVLTGEAAWSLNELEAVAKSNYIQRADKWHSYPEPDSPPTEDYKRFQGFSFSHQTPVFGQVMFPKYPEIFWTGSHMGPMSSSQMGPMPNQMGPITSNQMRHVTSNQMGHISNQMGSVNNQMGYILSNPIGHMSNQMGPTPMLQMSSMSNQIPQMSYQPMSFPSQMTQMPYQDMPNVTVPNTRFWPQEPMLPTHPKRSVWIDRSQHQNPSQNLFSPSFNDDTKNWPFYRSRTVFPPKLTNQRLAEHNSRFASYQNDKMRNFDKKIENREIFEQQNKRVFEKPIETREEQNMFKIKRTVNFGTVKPNLKQTRTLSEGLTVDNQRLFMSKSVENLNNNNTCLGMNLQRNTPNFSQPQHLTQKKDNQHTYMDRNPSKSTDHAFLNDEATFSDTTDSNTKFRSVEAPRTPEALKKNPFAPKSYDKHAEIESLDSTPFLQPAKQTVETSNIDEKIDLIIRSKSFENLSRLDEETFVENSPETENRNEKSEMQTANKLDEKTIDEARNDLDKNDLRYTLLAKRNKTEKSEQSNRIKDVPAKKMIKTYKEDTKPETSSQIKKRRVTFNLDEDIQEMPEEQDFDHAEVETPHHPDLSISGLKAMGCSGRTQWYIVVDTSVFLRHIHFLGDILKHDPTCTLLIPDAVRRETETLSRGDHRGRELVLLARNVMRQLANPPEFIQFQDPDVEEMMTDRPVADSIVNCCLLIMNENQHVVLITDDANLYQKATDSEIFTFMIQKILDGARIEEPELTFQFKKILNPHELKEKYIIKMADDVKMAPVKDSFPGNCFRRRLFDSVNVETNIISSQNKPNVIQKNTITSTLDGRKFPRQRDSEESSDLTLSSDVRKEIQKLNLKDTPRTLELQKNVSLKTVRINFDKTDSKVSKQTTKPGNAQSVIGVVGKENSTVAYSIKKIKKINAYTIEAQIKSFHVKDEVTEDRIALRLEEWMCSFTQIMEEALTQVLEPAYDPETQNPPPWSLPEAIEYTAEVFSDGDNSAIGLLCDKLLGMLARHLTDKGNPKESLTPHIFMKMLGCGILLIKCLNRIENDTELYQAEDNLLDILQTMEAPVGSDDQPNLVGSKINMADDDYDPRKNFVKKPSEVLKYLKQHFPAWRNHPPVVDFCQGKPKKVIRTNGRDANLLRIDHNKDIRMKSNDNNDANVDKKEVEKPKETGTKLLKRLAMNSLGQVKEPVMKEIDIEKRETVNKKMADMITDITGPKTITKFYDLNTVIFNQNTDIIVDENQKKSAKFDTEFRIPKIVRKIQGISIQSPGNDNKIKDKTYCTFDKPKTNESKVLITDKADTEKKVARTVEKNDFFFTKNKENKKNEDKPQELSEINTKYAEKEQKSKIDNQTQHKRFEAKNVDKKGNFLTKNKDNPKNDDKPQGSTEINTKYAEREQKSKIDNQTQHKRFEAINVDKKGNFLTKNKDNPKNYDKPQGSTEIDTKYAERERNSEINDQTQYERFDLDALDYTMMDSYSQNNSLSSSDDNRLMIDEDDQSDRSQINDSENGQKDNVSQIHEDVSQTHEDVSQIHKNVSQTHEVFQVHEDVSQTHEDVSQIHEDVSQTHEDVSQIHKDVSQIHGNRSQKHESGLQINKNSSQNEENETQPNEKVLEIAEIESKDLEEVKAYNGLKIFFLELSECFVNTYEFVNQSLSEISEKPAVTEGQRLGMLNKIGYVRSYFGCVIDKLEYIITREEDRQLVKSMVQKDKEAAEDCRLMNYSKLLRKCINQSKAMMTQLNLLMSLTDGDISSSASQGASVEY